MWLRVWMIIWKEFIQIFRDWRTLAVVIILPVLMLTLYGYAINFDLKNISIGLLDMDRTRSSREAVDAFSQNPYFHIALWFEDHRQVNSALDRGQVKLVIIIPRGFAEDLDEGRTAEMQIIVDGADSTTASTSIGYVEAIIQDYSAEVTLEAVRKKGFVDVENFIPLEGRTRFWYNPEQRSVNYIVPGLIVVILMMMSTLLTSMSVVREREQGSIEQLIVSPIRPHELMLGKLLPYVIIAFFDVLLVVAAGRLLFSVPLAGSPLLLLGLAGIFLMAALGIGLFISVVSPTQQTAMTFAMLASQLPSVLLSGFIFPISAMPKVVRWLTNIIPAKHFLIIVRSIFLKGVGLSCLWKPTSVLLVFGLLLLGLSSIKFKKRL